MNEIISKIIEGTIRYLAIMVAAKNDPPSEEQLMMRRMMEQGGSEPDGPVAPSDGWGYEE